MSTRPDQSNAQQNITVDYGTDVAPTPFNCRRCQKPSEKPGLCNGCANNIIGRSQQNRDQRLMQQYEERVGPQTSFYVMAFLVWPLSFAGLLIFSTITYPEYTIGQVFLWAALLSSIVTFVASWSLLFWPVFQKDPLIALLALKAPRRLYEHSAHLRAMAPKLFVLHFVVLAAAILIGFLSIVTMTFRTDQIGGMLGYKTNYGATICVDSQCLDQ